MVWDFKIYVLKYNKKKYVIFYDSVRVIKMVCLYWLLYMDITRQIVG